MTCQEVKAIIGDAPHMSLGQAQWLTAHLHKHGLKSLMEIGFMHGVSTCYLAAAVKPVGGHVQTFDLPRSLERKPSIRELLDKCGLAGTVTINTHEGGAAWMLMKRMPVTEQFDFCYIDALHTWSGTGLFFFLVEKFLRPGGWLLFDDLKYTIAADGSMTAPWTHQLTEEERTTPQVRKVWDLLVKDHPAFHNFIERSNWGMCQKKE